jgi:hypothetical protein
MVGNENDIATDIYKLYYMYVREMNTNSRDYLSDVSVNFRQAI